MEDWQIVLSILAPILGVLWHIYKANKDAHTEIGTNIKSVEDKVDDGFKVVNSDIKELNRSVGRLEGRLQTTYDRRPSEGGQD